MRGEVSQIFPVKTGAPGYTVGEPGGDPYVDLGVELKVAEPQIEDDIKPEEQIPGLSGLILDDSSLASHVHWQSVCLQKSTT